MLNAANASFVYEPKWIGIAVASAGMDKRQVTRLLCRFLPVKTSGY